MDTLLILPKTEAELSAVKAFCQVLNVAFEEEPEAASYNAEFVKKVKRSEQDFEAGRIHKINLDEIWK